MTRTPEQAAPLSERWAPEQVSELMATVRDPSLD
jgi:hypothetical protein